jgi:hypothetical protein
MYIRTVLFVICRSSRKCGLAPIKEGLTKGQKETEDRKLRNVRIERRGSLMYGKKGLETIEDVRLLRETFIFSGKLGRKGKFMAECLESKLHKL